MATAVTGARACRAGSHHYALEVAKGVCCQALQGAAGFPAQIRLTNETLSMTTFNSPTPSDFSALDARMQWYVDQEILGCVATAVLKGTEVVHRAQHGFMSVESREPLREDAIFRMYSNTKLVTSVAMMMLCEAGKTELDQPLAEILPKFRDMSVLKGDAQSGADTQALATPITIRHLLSHTAGLSYGFIEPSSVIDTVYAQARMNPLHRRDTTLEALCDELAALPLAYQPGTRWRYSLATDVCARVIEVVSGMRFDAYLHEHIFAPLGMVDTDFWVPADKHDRFTTMYACADLFDPLKPGFVPSDAPRSGAYTQRPAFLSGGGGLVSTMDDYLVFVQMLLAGGTWQGVHLLQEHSLQMMRTNQLAPGVGVEFPMWSMPNTVFGLGFAVKSAPGQGESEAAVGEYHWGGMAGTHTWMAPSPDITGLCFTQRMPGFFHPFSADFKRMVYAMFA
jgi:CubicO group peptidase (beta-lactamase class C family)